MKYINNVKRNQKSVQSVHRCKSVIQTAYDIVKAHGGVSTVPAGGYREKVETKEGEGTAFILSIPA